MIARLLIFTVIAVSLALPNSAKRSATYTPAQFDSWAACAVEKNNDEIIWLHALSSNHTNIGSTDATGLAQLSGAALYGAKTYAVVILGRDCAPEDVRMDNDYFEGLTKAVEARWTPTLDKRSLSRPTDNWTDCVVEKYRQLATIYLPASDLGVAGMPVTGSGIDPHKAIFDETPDCNALRVITRSIDYKGVYARINFKLRVAPRLAGKTADADRPDEGITK